MKYVIIGAGGLIGSNLILKLLDTGDEAIALSRNPDQLSGKYPWMKSTARWNGFNSDDLTGIINGADVVVNLAGESIAGKRWTARQKMSIINSRKIATSAVCDAFEKAVQKPHTLIQASATGFYKPQLSGQITESSPGGDNFLSEVCQIWEESSEKAKQFTRLIKIRTGVVLDKNGGALPQMLTPFRFFAGGHLGTGNQFVPWIHIQDEIEAIRFLAKHHSSEGIYNLSAPEPVSMRILSKAIGKSMNSPSWLHVPEFALKLLMGQMAEEMLFESYPVYPEKLLKDGFVFKYPKIDNALNNLLLMP